LSASTLSDQDLHAVFSGMPDGLVVYDRDGKIVMWNRAAENILQITAEQFEVRDPSQVPWDIIDEDDQSVPLENFPARVCLRTGVPQNGVIIGARLSSKDVRWLKINVKPIFVDGYDRPDKVVSTFLDVTVEINGRRQLEITRKNLEVAAELGGFYCWQLDYSTQTFWTNAEARKMLGNPTDYQMVVTRFWEMCHPDDLGAVRGAVADHGNSPEPLRIEHRMMRSDGVIAWVRTVLIFQRSETGKLASAFGVVHDISDRKENEDRLTAAKDAADAANRAKSEFIANISHEIRTPMNGVIGVAGALAKTEMSPKQNEMVQLIVGSAASLQRLLSDILDLSKIEAGHLDIQGTRFDFQAELIDAARLSQAAAHEKGLNFEIQLRPDTTGLFEGDPGRINQVVRNLLSNAVKFTASGKVSLRAAIEPVPATDDKVWVRIDVEDSGMGFGPENAAHLFKRFSQADNSITRRFGGSGLGLYLSRQIVEAMGGTIGARSTPRLGSIFSIRIPLRKLPDRSELDLLGPEPSLKIMESFADNPDARRIRILLAEDHPVNRKVVQLILAPFPVDLTIAVDGQQAVEAFKARIFDLVLMDVQMPVLDGLTAIRQIRAFEAERGRMPTPVAVLSANAMEQHRDEAIEAGADAHISKPVTPDRLLSAIDELLNGAAPDLF
jgi:PAS domain S-box-containing protein